jgi:DNA modification methylase
MRILNEETRLVGIHEIRQHERNVNEGDLGAIFESIQTNGFFGALVVQKSTGKILCGNHRYAAAVEAGAKEIPATFIDVDDKQALKILLADNRTARLGTDNQSALAELLSELANTVGLEGTGFDGDDLDQIIQDLAGGPVKPEKEAPEAQIDRAEELREKWGVERGQLWQVGRHRILCGDSTSAEDVARLMDGKKANAVLTDPPYGISQPGVTNDEPEKLSAIVKGAVANLPVENAAIVAFQSTRTFPEWLDATRKAGYHFERMLWLYKAAQCTFPWRGWILKSESILVSSIGKPKWTEKNPYAHDCYYLPSVNGELEPDSGWHGSVKPLEVVSDLLERISEAGDTVYEPFTGSGTTIVACEQTGRFGRGIEIDPNYVGVILERLSSMGLTPQLIDNGTNA